MRMRTALALLFFSSASASAQVWVGPEFQVNSYTTGSQQPAALASTGMGEFVIAWTSVGVDEDLYGIRARRYDAGGVATGPEFSVNAYTTGFQLEPAITSDVNGGFIVLWSSVGQDGSGFGIFGRRFDFNGPIGQDSQVNTYTTNQQSSGQLASAADGSFVATWLDYGKDGSGGGVFAQRFDPFGAPEGEFRVNTYVTGAQTDPRVGVAPDGRFVVAWSSLAQDGSLQGLFGQRYDAAGAATGPEFQVNVYTTGRQQSASIAVRADGSFVVVWSSDLPGRTGYGIVGRRYDAAGTALGGEFVVDQHTAGSHYSPDVAVDGKGNFVVTWTSTGQDGSGFGVFGRWFDASGAAQGGEFRINSYTTGNQQTVQVAAQGDGRFVVSWISAGQDGSGFGVFGQRLASDLIFQDGFESGTLAAWSSASTDGGDLSVSPAAAMKLTVAGLQAVVDDTAGLFVQDDTPGDENRYRARFYFDPNGFDPGETQAHRRTRVFLAFEEAPTRRVAAVVLRRLGGVYALMLRCRLDNNSQDDSGFFTVPDAPHAIEVDWKRSSGPDGLDGSCSLWIDGIGVSSRTNLDNSVSSVDFVRLGALSVKTGAAGAMYWDEFVSRRLNPIGP